MCDHHSSCAVTDLPCNRMYDAFTSVCGKHAGVVMRVVSHTQQPLYCTQAVQRSHMVITCHTESSVTVSHDQWPHIWESLTARDVWWTHRVDRYSYRVRWLTTLGHFTQEVCWPHKVSQDHIGQIGVQTGQFSVHTGPFSECAHCDWWAHFAICVCGTENFNEWNKDCEKPDFKTTDMYFWTTIFITLVWNRELRIVLFALNRCRGSIWRLMTAYFTCLSVMQLLPASQNDTASLSALRTL